MDAILASTVADDGRRLRTDPELEPQCADESLDDVDRRIRRASLDRRDMRPSDADFIGDVLLTPSERPTALTAQARERDPQRRSLVLGEGTHVPSQAPGALPGVVRDSLVVTGSVAGWSQLPVSRTG